VAVIVVVDHTPALCDRLAAGYRDHEVIPNKFEKGAGARNAGIDHVAGDVVALSLRTLSATAGYIKEMVPQNVRGFGRNDSYDPISESVRMHHSLGHSSVDRSRE
jgi:hypothetical protein